MLQNIIIITVVAVAAVFAVKRLIKSSCNCCNKSGKDSNCHFDCHLKDKND